MRLLMQDELDGLLAAEDSRALGDHLSSCRSCAVEFEALRAIDGVLAGRPVERSPRWLAQSVLAEIGRRASRRALAERVAVYVGVPVGLASAGVGVRALVAGTHAGDALSGAAARLSEPVRGAVASLIETPGPWASDPGVQGVVWALAAAALSFIAVTALRLSRKQPLGWN
ncbi:MAG: anti-sigma factor [Candidatus Eisenbacteria bacterium]